MERVVVLGVAVASASTMCNTTGKMDMAARHTRAKDEKVPKIRVLLLFLMLDFRLYWDDLYI